MDGKLSIIVDNRERNDDLLSQLGALGVEITVQPLPVGDYVISDRVCIERKTVADFESSIVSGRLFEQAGRVSEAYERPIIIIEGDREEFRMKGAVISGAIASLYIDYDIPVITTSGARESAEMIKFISRHEQQGKKRAPSVKGEGRSFTESQFMEKIVGNIPGIGIETAKKLLKHFGTVKAVTLASEEELVEVENVGERRAKLIFGILNSRYKEGP
jgi:Fanconi anemia group M protein